jgi:hypothetical protein
MECYDTYSVIASLLVWMLAARSYPVDPSENGQQPVETEGVGQGNKNDWLVWHLVMEEVEEAVRDVMG